MSKIGVIPVGLILDASRRLHRAIDVPALREKFERRGLIPSAPTPSPAQCAFLPDQAVNPVRPPPAPSKMIQDMAALSGTGLDQRPLVSIVLGSLNRRALLERAVESARANLVGMTSEIIVVDGGSTDGSIEWLITQRDVISIIQHNRYEHEGRARRRMSWGRFMNIGFRAAGAENIAMISDDCYLRAGAITNALKRMRAAESAGVKVGGCAFYYRDWPQDERYFVQRTLGGNLMINHGIYRRAALQSAGYCNEDDFVFYKADSDLSLSIWAAGYSIIDCPTSICEHYLSPQEQLRASNNELLDFDRRQLHRRWPGLTGATATAKMGKRFLEGVTPDSTAQRVFGDQASTADAT